MPSAIPILAAIALLVGLFLAAFNWITFDFSAPDKGVSPVPVFGGLLLVLGLLGFEQTRWFAWAGLVIDYPGTGRIVVYAFRGAWDGLINRSSSER